MPSSNSMIVKLIEDAGLTYYYEDEELTENLLRPTEEVWSQGTEAEYWIIIATRQGDYTLEDLINEEPVYAEFKSVKEGKVIFCNTATTDYFSMGVLEPHIMLKDLLYAAGHLSDHTPKYFHILK